MTLTTSTKSMLAARVVSWEFNPEDKERIYTIEVNIGGEIIKHSMATPTYMITARPDYEEVIMRGLVSEFIYILRVEIYKQLGIK